MDDNDKLNETVRVEVHNRKVMYCKKFLCFILLLGTILEK